MNFLDVGKLQAIDAGDYRRQRPFPWINPAGLLRDEAHATLIANLPDVSGFKKAFGHQRNYGQASHDRYSLKYRPGLDIPAPWQAFIDELQGTEYRAFLSRMLGQRFLEMDFLWFYTPSGCSISPHCDHKNKLGAHIFYLNTQEDWKAEWGGETLILDCAGRIPRRSAPAFEDFERIIPSDGMNNRSLLFSRSSKSWHGVRTIDCPDGYLRKIFLVAIKRVGTREKLSRYLNSLRPARADTAERTAA
jgi:hypothetical protein